jgi:hypothetical protein
MTTVRLVGLIVRRSKKSSFGHGNSPWAVRW